MSVDRARLEKRIGELSAIGGTGTSVTRLGLSPEEQRARELVGGWLSARGAKVWRDPAGNVYGRFGDVAGVAAPKRESAAILVGSHIDSVPEGGRFDGALGVLCAIEAVDALLDDGARFRRPVEVVGWCDEEGARFGIGLFGSCAAFGRLPDGAARRADRSGVTIADALRAIGESGDPTKAKRDPGELAAYLELHIEQGPRLAERGIPLGVVSDIVGILHARVTVRGRQDHAGATSMTAREDALAAAAEMVLAVESAARALPDAVGTVGEISVRPGAKNVVPGECVFSLDLRARSEVTVEQLARDVRAAIRRIGDARGVRSSLDVLSRVPAVPLDPKLRDLFLRSAKAVGVEAPDLFSGAGHDAENSQLAGVPTGMLFVRSTGGSHNPNELATVDDAALGARVLALALKELAG
ncbi:MAG TPA: Zn-dependent hydrolase [Candidatus Limnocylindria bacterium]|nr:Zn-dependent hydrolase [Candidatus Limnocylindria bacterium]